MRPEMALNMEFGAKRSSQTLIGRLDPSYPAYMGAIDCIGVLDRQLGDEKLITSARP